MQKWSIFTLTVLVVLAAAVYYTYDRIEQGAAQERSAALKAGIALFEEKKYEEALAELEKIPPGSTENWRAPYYRGSTQLILKQTEAAAASLQEALELNPDDPGVLYALGVAYYQLGKIKLSKAHFAAVLEINPADKQAKGLYDIMARIEQNMAAEESAAESGTATQAETPVTDSPDDQADDGP